MKKILFIAVPLTILTIVVVQTMVSQRTQNFASLFSEEDVDEVDTGPITSEPPPKENSKSQTNAKPKEETSKKKTPENKKGIEKQQTGVKNLPANEKKESKGNAKQQPESQKSAEAPSPTRTTGGLSRQQPIEIETATTATTTATPTTETPEAEKMAATLFGAAPSMYTTAMQQRSPTESARARAIPSPRYVFDVTQLNSPTVEQLAQLYDLHPLKDVVGKTIGEHDTDGDGLSDAEELRIGTNPRKLDSDGGGMSDGDEVLIYHTNPQDPKDPARTPDNKIDMRKIGVRITGFSDNQLVADATPLIRGVAPAGALIEVIATNSVTNQNFVLGQALANEGNVFIFESLPSTFLPDGDYSFKASLARITFNASDIAAQVLNPGNTTDQTLNDSQPVRAKIRSKLDVNPPAPKKLADKFLEGETFIKNVRIEIRDRKPVLVGKTAYGSQVLTTWHSLVMTSALIADTSAGDFEIQPQQEMEFGEHDVFIQAVRPTDGALSKAVKVAFKIEQPVVQTITATSNPLKPSSAEPAQGISQPLEVKSGFAAFMEKQNMLLWAITGGSLVVIIIVGVMIFASRKKKAPPLV